MTLLLCSCLPACDRGTIYLEDGGTDPQGEQFLMQSIHLEGTTNDPCTVEAGEQADQDGMADLGWWVHFLLDGGNLPVSLPEDDGSRQSHVLRVKATRTSDQEAFYKKVTVTFYD
jgi:hypothetical protein